MSKEPTITSVQQENPLELNSVQSQRVESGNTNPAAAPTPKGIFLFPDHLEQNQPAPELDLNEIETNPKGFIANLYHYLSSKFKKFADRFRSKPNGSENPVDETRYCTRKWIREELESLRAMIGSDSINFDHFIHKLAQLSSLSFFLSGQAEIDEMKTLQEALKKMLEDQKSLYNSNKVFYTDIVNGVFGVFGGAVGLLNPQIATATQTMSQGGQSASKILGNSVERDKANIQHLVEMLKQMIEQTRTHRASIDQQTGKMEEQRTQAQQTRFQMAGETNRG